MNRTRSFLNLLFYVARLVTPVVVLLVGVAGFLWLAGQKKSPAREASRVSKPMVETQPVKLYQGGLEIATDGVVVPFREIQIAAEVDGIVVRKSSVCRSGYFVKADTLLLVLEKTDYEKEVERLRAQLREAEASLKELEVNLTNTQSLLDLAKSELEIKRRNYTRIERLYGRGVATDADADKAREELISAETNVQTLENQLRTQQASRARLQAARDRIKVQLEKALVNLKRTEIYAPTDGVIVKDAVEQGDFVRRGTVVVRIQDTSAVEVKCNLKPSQMAWVWASVDMPGNQLKPIEAYELPPLPVTVVYTVNGQQYQWQAHLERYEGIGMDDQTRMVPCRVLVDKPQEVQAIEDPSSPVP